MEVANELKRLSSDVNTVLLYDEAEENEKMMRSLKEEGEKDGIKKGIKQGAKYNVPIDVDINRRRYPLKWTYQEGMKSSIIDTKIWVF